MIVVISGSRPSPDAPDLEAYTERILEGELARLWATGADPAFRIGGAKGVDTYAEDYLRNLGLEPTIHLAQWGMHPGNSAGSVRNWEMMKGADLLIAILVPWSKGTRNAIAAAITQGVEARVWIYPDPLPILAREAVARANRALRDAKAAAPPAV